MSSSYNKIVLIGNVTRDPEIKSIASGAAMTKFTLAVNRRTKNQEQETDFIDIVAWDKLAEICNSYLKRGMSCLVEGRLSIRSYESNGEKRKATEVVASTMQMLDRANAGTSRATNDDSAATAQAQNEGGGVAVAERTEMDEAQIEELFAGVAS